MFMYIYVYVYACVYIYMYVHVHIYFNLTSNLGMVYRCNKITFCIHLHK